MKENIKFRIQWIDIAKGIGIILVIFQHCLTATNMSESIVSKSILSFHMPLFFFLSGYVYQEKTNFLFFADKVKGLLLPVLLYRIANIIIWCILSIIGMSAFYSVLSFAGFWFLESLFQISLIYYVFDKVLLVKRKTRKEYLHLFLGGALFACGMYYSKSIIGKEITIATTLVGYLFFCLGKFVRVTCNNADNKKILKTVPDILKLIIGIMLILFMVFIAQFNTPVQMYINDYGEFIIFLVNALVGIIGICLVSMYIQDNNLLEFYGKNSLVILLTHFPLFRILPKVIGYIIENKIINSVISLIIICIIEYFLIKVVNKFFPFMTGKIRYDDEK